MEAINTPQQILQHHLTAFAENNVDKIMEDYSEESVLCTPDGMLNGMGAIRAFFGEALKLFPPGKTNFALKQSFINDNKAYILWNSDSPVAAIPVGTDSFEIKYGKIVWQTMAAHIILK